jgi:hypothetical protein
LRSPLGAEVESPPEWILVRTSTRIARQRRQTRLIACGLAAAAVLVIAVGWTLKLNRQASVPVDTNLADVTRDANSQQSPSDTMADQSAPSLLRRATFVGGPEVLVVPVESRHPNVTVVRIYPAYVPDHAAQANAELPAAADESVWPFELNGG